MKSASLTGLRKLEVREVPDPLIEHNTDVLLKVGAAGVCGSDIHYYTTGRIGSQIVQYPFRLGHEFGATVVGTGTAVKRVAPGDKVAVDPAMPCGECDQCRANRRHTCRRLKFLGCPGQGEGCLCEYIVMPESSCFRLDRRTSLETAALTEPLSIGIYAVRLAGSVLDARIGILGCGPIGLSVLLAAQTEGAARAYVTDRLDYRLDVARRAGATWKGNPDKEDVVATVTQEEPLLLDAVFECCGQQEALDQAVQLLKPGGKLVLVGIPEVDRISFAIDLMRRKEITLLNVRRQNECARAAVHLVEGGLAKPEFMITHRFPLHRAAEAFDLVAGYRDGVIKAMIIF